MEVNMDFCDLPKGKHLLVVIGDYSHYPEVEMGSITSACSVLPTLDKILSAYSIATVIKSDNVPPFTQFAEYLAFKHHKLTLHWPQANGEVERFMRTLKKAL